MEPYSPNRPEPWATTDHDRLRQVAVDMARDACPMVACLLLPLALILGVAYYAASPGNLARPAAAAPPPGPYDAFRFEQVGVGVRRLIDDGTGYRPGDYRLFRGETVDTIAVGPDGSVLACCDRPGPLLNIGGETTLHQLGQREPVASWDDSSSGLAEAHDLAVASDGTVWLAGDRVAELAHGAWRKLRPRASGNLLETGRDGEVWADISSDELRIVRYQQGRMQIFSAERGLPQAVRKWGDRVTGIATTPDGNTWVGVSGERPRRPGGLLRYDGEVWHVVRPLGRGVDAHVEGVTTAPDGTLWVYLSRSRPKAGMPWRATMHLARRDATGWTTFGSKDGVPQHHKAYRRSGSETVPIRVGPDGTVWLTTFSRDRCAHLVSFADGRTSDYLPDGACVHDLELDPDGRAWASVYEHSRMGAGRDGAELYLVDPAT